MDKRITLEQLVELAEEFDYNPLLVRAVTEVETPNGGFLSDGRITILFERHIFYRLATALTEEQRRTNTDICHKTPGGYLGGTLEWLRLQKAMALDRQAGLQAASWGKGQVMGFNHQAAGYHTVNLMVEDFAISEMNQLRGMLRFIQANRHLDGVMKSLYPQKQDFATFAAGYNGKNYAVNKYHSKIEKAYQLLHDGKH